LNGSAFERLEDVVLEDLFPDVDLALRRGRHIGIEDAAEYQFLIDGQAHLETFYSRYGCELIHRSEGYFYLLPSNDRLGRRTLSRGEMLVGQVLALLYLDPAAVQRGGLSTRSELLARLDMLVGAETLVRTLNPRQKKFDERVAEDLVRTKVDDALRTLESLGFVDVRDPDEIHLRPALFRFADPVRGREAVDNALERLVRTGEVIAEDQQAEPEDET
jgi:chromosome partition protein MukE